MRICNYNGDAGRDRLERERERERERGERGERGGGREDSLLFIL